MDCGGTGTHLVTVEEGEQQQADVGAVHVGVRHDDHAVVAQGVAVELDAAHAQSQRRYQRLARKGGRVREREEVWDQKAPVASKT